MTNSKSKKTSQDIEITRKPTATNSSESAAPTKSKGVKLRKVKKAEVSDLDETLLDDAGDLGIEDIPDLTEFEVPDEDAEDLVESDADADDEDEESLEDLGVSDDEIILTDAEGRRLCRVRECDQAAMVETYCRFHYLQNWKRIQNRRSILADGKLERYVTELTGRFPDKFLEMIRKDLRTEKDFLAAIAELEIDESSLENDYEEEDSQTYIEEVRGVSEGSISEEEEF